MSVTRMRCLANGRPAWFRNFREGDNASLKRANLVVVLHSTNATTKLEKTLTVSLTQVRGVAQDGASRIVRHLIMGPTPACKTE
jgi:hypothetical protein